MLLRTLIAVALTLTICASASSPEPTPSALTQDTPLKADEKKPLLQQFKKALNEEEKILDHQEKVDTKDFTLKQAQELKDWRSHEKRVRRDFFAQHSSGPDRRDYVQKYIERKKEFDQKQKDDFAVFKSSQKTRHENFKAQQKNRESQFKDALDHDQRPARSLWSS